MNRGEDMKAKISKVILYIVLIFIAIICFMPFYIMIINCTQSSADIAQKIMFLPGKSFMANYRRMQASVNIWYGFKNSVIISALNTALSAYFGALTAYAFSKFKFKGNKVLFVIVLSTMMFPSQLGLIGLFKVYTSLHLVNNRLSLILPGIANANLVFFIKLYIDAAVNDSIIESARIEGCGEFKIFNKVVLPIITPSIATMSMFNFITVWNSYLVPLTVLYDEKKYTLPIMTAMAKGVYRTDYGASYMCIAISMIPIMIVFLFCSKFIIGGLTAGSVKE